MLRNGHSYPGFRFEDGNRFDSFRAVKDDIGDALERRSRRGLAPKAASGSRAFRSTFVGLRKTMCRVTPGT